MKRSWLDMPAFSRGPPDIASQLRGGGVPILYPGALARPKLFQIIPALFGACEGVAKAKAEGKYRGRAPTARAKAPEVRKLHGEGVGPSEIAKRLKISVDSLSARPFGGCLRRGPH